jgi:hypothetical protein
MKDKFEQDPLIRKIILDEYEVASLEKALFFLRGIEIMSPNSQYLKSTIHEVIESVFYIMNQYWNAPIATEQDFQDRKKRYQELDLIPNDELLRASRQHMERMKKGKKND